MCITSYCTSFNKAVINLIAFDNALRISMFNQVKPDSSLFRERMAHSYEGDHGKVESPVFTLWPREIGTLLYVQ
jgi:hypothetical protein